MQQECCSWAIIHLTLSARDSSVLTQRLRCRPRLCFYSENQVFHSTAVVGEVSSEVAERVAKEIAEEVAETVSKQVGETVSANVAEQTAKEVVQQAYKNVQERAIAKNGKELSGGALLQALRKEAKELSTETLETAAKKTTADVAHNCGSEAGKSIPVLEKTAANTALGTGAVIIYNWGDTST